MQITYLLFVPLKTCLDNLGLIDLDKNLEYLELKRDRLEYLSAKNEEIGRLTNHDQIRNDYFFLNA